MGSGRARWRQWLASLEAIAAETEGEEEGKASGGNRLRENGLLTEMTVGLCVTGWFVFKERMSVGWFPRKKIQFG